MNKKLSNFKKLTLMTAIALVGLFLSLAYITPIQTGSVRADWTYPDGYNPHGGYVDRVTMVVYPPEDEQLGLQALQAGLIYAWDERVPAANIPELQATAGVEVTTVPGDMYRMFCLNTNRFPTNHTAYRRAVAFAMDKDEVVQASTGGLAFKQDCAVPIALGNWTYEEQLVETYYAKNIVAANATLDDGGFIDLNGDGWRDYDADDSGTWTAGDIDSADFITSMYHTAGHAPSGNAVTIAVAGLTECGIRSEVSPQDFYAMIDMISDGDYWLSCFTFINMYQVDFLYDFFRYNTSANQWYFNNWQNTTYDGYADALMAAKTEAEANDWAWKCQEILWVEQPMIVCYNDVYTHAYRVDRWEGYINMKGRNRIGNGYSMIQVHLTDAEGGPFGCYPTEYIRSLNEGLDTTNFLMSNSGYTSDCFSYVYESLAAISPYDWTFQPALAKSWTIEDTVESGDILEGQKYSFVLYENATWHDGNPVIADDCIYSIATLGPQDPYNAENYENVYKTVKISDTEFEIYVNASGYFEWIRATQATIFPKHIWEVPTNISAWVPTVAELVGSGPFIFSAHVPGQYIVLERNPDWHFAIEHPERTPCPTPIPWTLYIGIGVIVVVIIIIAGVYFFRIRK